MANLTKEQRAAKLKDTTGIEYYDKYLVKVKRERAGKNVVTKSISIMDLVRGKMPNSKVTIDALNASQEHQNPSEMGYPVIQWYFPAGTVKPSDEYKAHDLYKEWYDESLDKDVRVVKHDGSYEVCGLVITDKKIIGWEEGKRPGVMIPVYEKASQKDVEEIEQ